MKIKTNKISLYQNIPPYVRFFLPRKPVVSLFRIHVTSSSKLLRIEVSVFNKSRLRLVRQFRTQVSVICKAQIH